MSRKDAHFLILDISILGHESLAPEYSIIRDEETLWQVMTGTKMGPKGWRPNIEKRSFIFFQPKKMTMFLTFKGKRFEQTNKARR